MSGIISAIVVTVVVFLIYGLLVRKGRGANSEASHAEVHQRAEDENRRLGEESPYSTGGGNSWLTQSPKSDPELNESVTPSLTITTDQSRCPACGAIITVNDERCPSCEISFVTDSSPKWTLGTVGPSDGIYLPRTEVSD